MFISFLIFTSFDGKDKELFWILGWEIGEQPEIIGEWRNYDSPHKISLMAALY
jgi:hypothetical protein